MRARTEIRNIEYGQAPMFRAAATMIRIVNFKPNQTIHAAHLARFGDIVGHIGEFNVKKNAYRRVPPGGNPGCDRRRNEDRRT